MILFEYRSLIAPILVIILKTNMEETFGDIMTKAAENKRKDSTDEEYNDWLCQLSEEFAAACIDWTD